MNGILSFGREGEILLGLVEIVDLHRNVTVLLQDFFGFVVCVEGIHQNQGNVAAVRAIELFKLLNG